MQHMPDRYTETLPRTAAKSEGRRQIAAYVVGIGSDAGHRPLQSGNSVYIAECSRPHPLRAAEVVIDGCNGRPSPLERILDVGLCRIG